MTPSPTTGAPTATTTSSHDSSSSSSSSSSGHPSSSSSRSRSSSTLAAHCGCLVVLCRHRSVRDLGQGGLLRQLRDSFLAGVPGGRLSAGERRLLLNTALRMVRGFEGLGAWWLCCGRPCAWGILTGCRCVGGQRVCVGGAACCSAQRCTWWGVVREWVHDGRCGRPCARGIRACVGGSVVMGKGCACCSAQRCTW